MPRNELGYGDVDARPDGDGGTLDGGRTGGGESGGGASREPTETTDGKGVTGRPDRPGLSRRRQPQCDARREGRPAGSTAND